MIKVTYLTTSRQTKKPERTTVNIFPGRMFVRYDVPGKADATVKQMLKDGKTGVLYSRGAMIQMFRGKSEKEILKIVKEDIKNGIIAAEDKTGKRLKIKDLVVEE